MQVMPKPVGTVFSGGGCWWSLVWSDAGVALRTAPALPLPHPCPAKGRPIIKHTSCTTHPTPPRGNSSTAAPPPPTHPHPHPHRHMHTQAPAASLPPPPGPSPRHRVPSAAAGQVGRLTCSASSRFGADGRWVLHAVPGHGPVASVALVALACKQAQGTGGSSGGGGWGGGS